MTARGRIALALAIASALIIFALLGVAFYGPDFSGRMLVYPKSQNARRAVSVKSIEDRNKEGGMLITYEIMDSQTLFALTASKYADIIGTNYLYASVTGYRMLSGGFFTETAQDEGAAQIVLNEPAARALFGSVSIAGEIVYAGKKPLMAVGVIDDKSEDVRAYVLANDNATLTSLLALSAESDAYVINELKELGATQEEFNFTNIGSLGDALWGKAFMGMSAAVICAFLVLIRLLIKRIHIYTGGIKKALETMYIYEAIRKRPGAFIKTAATAALMLSSAAFAVFLLVNMFEIYISMEAADALKAARSAEFRVFADTITSLHISADYLLCACVVCLCAVAVLAKAGSRADRLDN